MTGPAGGTGWASADELAAAHVLAVSGLTTQAVGVATRAALRAAESALLLLDRVPPDGDASLTAAFVRHVVRERGLDHDAGRALRLLVNRQHLAEVVAPSMAETDAALVDARFVIETVREWVDASRRVARERRRSS